MDQERPPRVVVVVPNQITGDSRVIKTALSAAQAGWDVVLLGQGRHRRRESWLGSVRVIRLPIQRPNHDAYEARLRTTTHRRPLGYLGPAQAAAAGARLGRHVERRRASAGRSWRRPAVEAELFARRALHRVRRWNAGRETVTVPDVPADQVQWRRDWPILVDWSLTFGPVIEELAPDLVHANDAIMVGVVAEAVRKMRADGKQVAWLYDAHEHVTATDWGSPVTSAAYRAYEREYIAEPDAIVTVSDEIASLLEREYGLERRPAVVRNVPVRHVERADPAPSVRHAAGVPEGVPLLVYSGYLVRERGVDTIISALKQLPDVWLVMVTGESALRSALLELAHELGVRDRVKTAPYVSPVEVPAYLSTADLGVIASRHSPNYEASTPTKLSEYLHARLPLVVSDLRTNAAFVRQHGVGEVFQAENPDSLAEAVRRGLLKHRELQAAIGDELLDELSWERQVVPLMELYSKLTGIVPTPPAVAPSYAVAETAQPVPSNGDLSS